jgi:hypothetical protein
MEADFGSDSKSIDSRRHNRHRHDRVLCDVMQTWHWPPRFIECAWRFSSRIARSNKKLSKHTRALTWSISWSRPYVVDKYSSLSAQSCSCSIAKCCPDV